MTKKRITITIKEKILDELNVIKPIFEDRFNVDLEKRSHLIEYALKNYIDKKMAEDPIIREAVELFRNPPEPIRPQTQTTWEIEAQQQVVDLDVNTDPDNEDHFFEASNLNTLESIVIFVVKNARRIDGNRFARGIEPNEIAALILNAKDQLIEENRHRRMIEAQHIRRAILSLHSSRLLVKRGSKFSVRLQRFHCEWDNAHIYSRILILLLLYCLEDWSVRENWRNEDDIYIWHSIIHEESTKYEIGSQFSLDLLNILKYENFNC